MLICEMSKVAEGSFSGAKALGRGRLKVFIQLKAKAGQVRSGTKMGSILFLCAVASAGFSRHLTRGHTESMRSK